MGGVSQKMILGDMGEGGDQRKSDRVTIHSMGGGPLKTFSIIRGMTLINGFKIYFIYECIPKKF